MKKLFKTCVIANTPCCKNADKIRSWVESNGGKYASEISADVTHLLTSKRAWIEYTPLGIQLNFYQFFRRPLLLLYRLNFEKPELQPLPECHVQCLQ